MKSTIEKYALGADLQDAVLIDSVFHDFFRVVAFTSEGVRILNKQEYLDLLKAKKIGGEKRELRILSCEEERGIGRAVVELVGNKVTFHDNLSLVMQQGRWQIIHNLTRVS